MQKFSMTLVALFVGLQAFGESLFQELQQDTVKNDTTWTNVVVTPNAAVETSKALGYAHYILNNPILRDNSLGQPILFTMSGQVPGIPRRPDYWPASGGWEYSGSTPLIVDGVMFNSRLVYDATPNTFDYEPAIVLRNSSAVAPYGSGSTGGGIILNSKTGEGYERATFDFNSYTDYHWSNGNDFALSPTKTSFWIQSTSFAYSQDYGKVDARASVNHNTILGSDIYGNDVSLNKTAITANAGFQTKAFSARLVLLDSYLDNPYAASETTNNFFNSNLKLAFDPLKWLSLTSTSNYSRGSFASSSDMGPISQSKYNSDDKRVLGNLFVNFTPINTANVIVKPYIGYQIEQFNVEQTQANLSNGLHSYSEARSEVRKGSFIAGINTSYKNLFFVQTGLRSETPSLYQQSFQLFWANTSFVFSDLLAPSSVFSLGKIRASFSSADQQYNEYYPVSYQSTYSLFNNPVTDKHSFELGTDLGFVNNRIMFSLTWLRETFTDINYVSTFPPVQFQYDLKSTGLEFVLKVDPIRRKNFNWHSSLLFGKYKIIIDEPSNGGSSELGQSYPDWTLSFLNQITASRFTFSLLIDNSQGGNVLESSYPPMLVNASYMRMRDLSAGYQFNLPSSFIRLLNISLIGRNLWLIDSKSGKDPEASNSVFTKSIALSVSVGF